MNKHTRVWSLQEAKARLSEVVRLAQSEGPQLVTVHGKSAVTIVAVPKDARPERKLTGKDLWEALSAGPKFDLEIPERPKDGFFREVDL
ncbi:MAG: type II toxin-antitoxin system prevent-host-death family antitoxin [Aestuariivirga sp.]